MKPQIAITPNSSDNELKDSHALKELPKQDEPAKIVDFEECIDFLNQQGKKIFGKRFLIDPMDYEVVFKIIVYLIKDIKNARKHKIDLNKGILLSGPIGCGKTTLMRLVNLMNTNNCKFSIKSCREISFDFITNGYQVILNYSYQSLKIKDNTKAPKTWCFEGLGMENNLKYYGSECNVLAEILMNRSELFIEIGMLTHITTHLTAQEIEKIYGKEIRSKMRGMFNLISFNQNSKDKRI